MSLFLPENPSLILPGDHSSDHLFAKYQALTTRIKAFDESLEEKILSTIAPGEKNRGFAKALVLPEAGPSEFNFHFLSDESGASPTMHSSMSFPDHSENFLAHKVLGTNPSNGGELWTISTDFIDHPQEQKLPPPPATKRLKREYYHGILDTVEVLMNYFLTNTMRFIDFAS